MSSHLSARNLTHLQRLAWVQKMGREIRDLHEDGYAAEADRLLEDLYARLSRWRVTDQQ